MGKVPEKTAGNPFASVNLKTGVVNRRRSGAVFMIFRMPIVLAAAGFLLAGGLVFADTSEIDSGPVQMGYEIVGTVPEEGYLIKGEGWTQISYVTKDDTGRPVKVARLCDLKAAIEVALVNGTTLRAYYRAFLVFPKEYWPEKGSGREEFPSKTEIEAPLDKLEKLDEFQTGGHAERFSVDLAGAALKKLEELGYAQDEAFVTAFKMKIAELIAGLHAEIPNQIRWMFERYLEQVKQEAEAAEKAEITLKAEAEAARMQAAKAAEAPAAESAPEAVPEPDSLNPEERRDAPFDPQN